MLNASIERACNPQKKPSPKVAPDEYIIKIVGKRVRSVAEKYYNVSLQIF